MMKRIFSFMMILCMIIGAFGIQTEAAGNTDKALQKKYSTIATEAVKALAGKDFKKLAALASPKSGITFSSTPYIASGEAATFQAKQLLELGAGKNKTKLYVWGVDGSRGKKVKLSFADFHKKYLAAPNYLGKGITISYGDIQTVGSDSTNYQEVYPNATAVMYYYPGTEKNGNMDWKAMLLVFQQEGKKICLSAVLYGEFTP